MGKLTRSRIIGVGSQAVVRKKKREEGVAVRPSTMKRSAGHRAAWYEPNTLAQGLRFKRKKEGEKGGDRRGHRDVSPRRLHETWYNPDGTRDQEEREKRRKDGVASFH